MSHWQGTRTAFPDTRVLVNDDEREGDMKYKQHDGWEEPSPLHDTPIDCLFDDDPEDPRDMQKLEGLDKRDYDNWRQRKIDGGLASTGRRRTT